MVERCPDKTEVDGPIPSTLTKPKGFFVCNMDKNDKKLISKEDMMIYKPVLFFYVKTTSWIIFPLIVATLAGRYVEKSFGSQTIFFITVMIGFGITCYGIYREVKSYKKSLENKELPIKEENNK